MKIKKVKFTNFRNVPDIEKELNGSNILLLAENAKGKSNFIKGIQAALAGKLGKFAIAEGKDKSEVEVLMSDYDDNGQCIPGTDYTFKLKIRKDRGGDEKVGLEVIAPNGFKEERKTVIGSIAGEIELDYNFVELSKTATGKKKQLEIIKSYLDEETLKSLALYENKTKQYYDERTEINRDIKAIEGFIFESGLLPMDFTTYANKIDVTDLQAKITEGLAMNSKIKDVQERIKERYGRRGEIEAQIAQLQIELKNIEKKNDDAAEWLKQNKPVDIESLNAEMATASEHNMKHSKVMDLNKRNELLAELKDKAGELTALYESTKQAISDAIADMDHPIEGISFDSDNVYYKGKLVDESTMSTAEIMMLEAELKMCKAPGAEVVFIQRGESLGMQMLSTLQRVAKERGYQLIMEQVERGTEELRVEFMPDFTNEKVEA